GFLSALRSHQGALLVAAATTLFLVLGAGSLLAGVAVASNRPAPAPIVSATLVQRPLPASPPPAVALRTCSVDELADQEALRRLHAAVLRREGGRAGLLLGRGEDEAVPVGGVMKLYTAAAALAALGPDFRIATSVVEGTVP